MRYMQLFENSDYNIAKKLHSTLSDEAQDLLNWWEEGECGVLDDEFENKSKIAKEIWVAGQPIRDNIRSRVGDKITLYRGMANYVPYNKPNNFRLFSWTSSEKVAQKFAEIDEIESNKKSITKKEVALVVKKFNERGYVSFLGYKFLKISENLIKVYHNKNKNKYKYNYKKRFDNVERAISYYVDKHNKKVQDYNKERILDSRIFKKRIPVNNIVWVLMYKASKGYLHENEYIVLNYSK